MNKTVTIHICGILFHIEEDAYQTLRNYLQAIRNNLGSGTDTDEIINDIELRVAELLDAKRVDKETVIVQNVIDEVIDQLGEPETISEENGFEEDDENHRKTAGGESKNQSKSKRRIYRDEDKGSLGGVCAGLANHFNTEVVYIRLLFVLTVIFAGFGILPYIILWIVIPAAKTPEEKAHMYGDEITLDGIKKKFHEEKTNLKDTFERVKKNVHEPKFNRVTDVFESLLHAVIKILSLAVKLIGAVLIYVAIIIGIVIVVTAIVYYSKGVIPFVSHQPFISQWSPELFSEVFLNHPSDLNWIFFALIVLITAICLALFNSGLKLGKKSNTKWLGYIEFPLFIAAVVLLIYHAILIGTDFEKNITQNEIVTIESPNKHLYISGFTNNNAFSRDYDDNMFNDFVQIKNGNIINKNVKIRIKQGTKDKVEVEFTRRAHAETDWEAINRAENIKYNYQINNDTLILANTFTIPKEDKMRGQEFRIDVYLPIDYAVQFDKEVHKFSYRIPFKENLYIAHNINTSNYTWNLNGKLVKADLSTQ